MGHDYGPHVKEDAAVITAEVPSPSHPPPPLPPTLTTQTTTSNRSTRLSAVSLTDDESSGTNTDKLRPTEPSFARAPPPLAAASTEDTELSDGSPPFYDNISDSSMVDNTAGVPQKDPVSTLVNSMSSSEIPCLIYSFTL